MVHFRFARPVRCWRIRTPRGGVQTVPRAELRALLSILERVTPRRMLTVRVLLGLRGDPAAKAKADNGDMWVDC